MSSYQPLTPHFPYEIVRHPSGHPSEWLMMGQEIPLQVFGVGDVRLMVTATSSVARAAEYTAHGIVRETNQAALCTFYHPCGDKKQTLRIKP